MRNAKKRIRLNKMKKMNKKGISRKFVEIALMVIVVILVVYMSYHYYAYGAITGVNNLPSGIWT